MLFVGGFWLVVDLSEHVLLGLIGFKLLFEIFLGGWNVRALHSLAKQSGEVNVVEPRVLAKLPAATVRPDSGGWVAIQALGDEVLHVC